MRYGDLILTAECVRSMLNLMNKAAIECHRLQNTFRKPPTLGIRGQLQTAVTERVRRASPDLPAAICPGFADALSQTYAYRSRSRLMFCWLFRTGIL